MPEVDASWKTRLLYKEGRLRAGYRIALFFFFFFLFAVAAQYAITVLPRQPMQWGSLAAMTFAALLAGWIVLSCVDQRPFGALGFAPNRAAIPELLGGFAIGGVLIGAAVLLLLITGAAVFAPDSGTLPGYLGFLGWTFLFFALAAAFEEIIFRGYPFQALVQWIGAWPAILVASAIFSYLHGQNPNVTPLALVNIFVAGVLLSIAYLKTRSLWFATGVHLGWNWTMASLLDFPVSGLGFETPLYTGIPIGPEWWTGGAFGPEAGVVGTLILIPAIFWLMRTRRIREDPETRRLQPLVDDRLGEEPFR